MKALISYLVLLCFSVNVFASTGTVNELSRHIDNYQYSLTVEWDQKDQKFYQKVTEKFLSEMEKLIRNGHLTKEEVLTLLEKRVSSKNVLQAMKLKLSLLSHVDSQEALADIVKESSKEMYAKGASWNGEILIPLAIGIVILAVLAYKWWWDYNHKCVAWEERYDCSTSSWDDRNCSTEYDEEGNSYEECDYYWNQEITETCGPMNFCTEYEEINN